MDKYMPVGKISHSDWLETYCRDRDSETSWVTYPGEKDIARVHRIDDSLMTFSDFGARVHDPNSPNTELDRTLFANPIDACPMPYGWCGVID